MKRLSMLLAFLALAATAQAQQTPTRPAYSRVQQAGTAKPQETTLNFTSGCTVTDDSGSHRTNVACAAGTVTAVNGTSPIVSSGGTAPDISCPTCTILSPGGAQTGYLYISSYLRAGSLVAPSIDTATAATLQLGPTTATSIELGDATIPTTVKGALTTSGSRTGARRTASSSPVTVSATTDYELDINVGGAATVNLPAAASGREYLIADISGNASVNNIIISPAAGTINGAASITLTDNYAAVIVHGDGTNWHALRTGAVDPARLVPTASAAGRIAYDNSVTWSALAAGTAGQYLRSGGVGAPTWQKLDLSSSSEVQNTLPIGNGGTGLASAGGVNDRVLYTSNGTTWLAAQVANAALANSSIVVTTASPLGGAGTISLGGTLALTCTTCVTTARTVSTTSPLGGGGALSGDLTLTCTTCVTTSRSISTSTGLSGGGDLSANRTLTVDQSTAFAWTGAHTYTLAVATAQTPAATLLTSTAATSGNQKHSPGLVLQGNGFGTTAGTSQAEAWLIQTRPVQGTTPTADLVLWRSDSGGSYTERFSFRYNNAANNLADLVCSHTDCRWYNATTDGIYASGGAVQGIISGTAKVTLLSTAFYPQTDLGLTSGRSSNRWSQVWSAVYAGVAQAPAHSATPTYNCANGETIHHLMTGNVTSWTMTAGVAGQRCTLVWEQDSMGNRTLAGTPANVKFAGGAFTLTTTGGKLDSATFVYDINVGVPASSYWVEIARSQNL